MCIRDSAWEAISQKIRMSEPEGPGMYLGCKQVLGEVTLGDGTRARTMTYDMSSFLSQCVDSYVELAGVDKTTLRRVGTPFLPEDMRQSPARSAAKALEPRVECEWCLHTMPVSSVCVRGTLEANEAWSRMQPQLAALVGIDPSGDDGNAGDVYEQVCVANRCRK